MALAIWVIEGDGVRLAPVEQGIQDGNQCLAGFGQSVLVTRGSTLVLQPCDGAGVLQGLQPGRDAVAGCSRAPHDVGEVGGSKRDLADDEQRPALADEFQSRRDRARPTRSSANGTDGAEVMRSACHELV